MLSWVNRVVILVSVVLLTLTTLTKQDNLPLSQATLRLGHLFSFRYAWHSSSRLYVIGQSVMGVSYQSGSEM